MSAAPEVTAAPAAPGPAGRPRPTVLRRAEDPAPPLARRLAARLGNEWAPRAAWTISRTGRPGLVGIALLLGAALFLFSTHLNIAADVDALRADVAAAHGQPRTPAADKAAGPGIAIRALPARTEVPAILRQLFDRATKARLAVDTGKYEVNATASGGIVRYHVAFPLAGPYPQVRAFIDATLATMPAVALSDLALDRKSIADGTVEAQIRMTVYTAAAATTAPPRTRSAAAVAEKETPAAGKTGLASAEAKRRALEELPPSDRVVGPKHAAALFAQHTWFVLPPPPPPAPPPPPPEPTAPPFPYTLIGSYAPEGHPPVYFLAHGDRVIDAHVGDRLEGVYQFESAAGGQLVFVYLPLKIRQTIAAGAPK